MEDGLAGCDERPESGALVVYHALLVDLKVEGANQLGDLGHIVLEASGETQRMGRGSEITVEDQLIAA